MDYVYQYGISTLFMYICYLYIVDKIMQYICPTQLSNAKICVVE
jgi:hypothetical protein